MELAKLVFTNANLDRLPKAIEEIKKAVERSESFELAPEHNDPGSSRFFFWVYPEEGDPASAWKAIHAEVEKTIRPVADEWQISASGTTAGTEFRSVENVLTNRAPFFDYWK